MRIWGNDGAVQVLKGHEGAVLCVLVLPNGDILSGGGDKLVKLWSGSKCVHTFAGHTDSVRCALDPRFTTPLALCPAWHHHTCCISRLVSRKCLPARQ